MFLISSCCSPDSALIEYHDGYISVNLKIIKYSLKMNNKKLILSQWIFFNCVHVYRSSIDINLHILFDGSSEIVHAMNKKKILMVEKIFYFFSWVGRYNINTNSHGNGTKVMFSRVVRRRRLHTVDRYDDSTGCLSESMVVQYGVLLLRPPLPPPILCKWAREIRYRNRKIMQTKRERKRWKKYNKKNTKKKKKITQERWSRCQISLWLLFTTLVLHRHFIVPWKRRAVTRNLDFLCTIVQT